MLRAEQFQPIAVRLVAFTPNHSDFKPSEILAAILGRFADRFTGEIQSLPLPDNVPPDFPRIQLSSQDGAWAFAASPSRLTSTWSLKGDGDKSVSVDQIVQCSRDVIQEHVGQNTVQVGRLALVLTRSCPCASPAQVLIERFCNDDVRASDSPNAPLRHSRNFELHNHKRYEIPLNGVTINSWVRCKTGALQGTETPVVTVEHDINTLAEEIEDRHFDTNMIERFFEIVRREADEILVKYFP